MEEVNPFLQNILKGRNIPEQRIREVAHHYEIFRGISPINAQNRKLIAALRDELYAHGPRLPVYWGNRNWHPLLRDTLRQMAGDGVRMALAFFTSAYSSYSGCRQYRENIQNAQEEVGPNAPQIDKLRCFYNHPGFINPNIENVQAALNQIPEARRPAAPIVFTAHSIPLSMASHCPYQVQLMETSRLIAEGLGYENWRLVYQSRSGPPSQPWLGPDIVDTLSELRSAETEDVVVAPVGFISDHMEVIYDLDIEAHRHCEKIGLNMVRAATVGCHPTFIGMIRELIMERMSPDRVRLSLGALGPSYDNCPEDCCLIGGSRPLY